MDDYILHILTDWQLDKSTSIARANLLSKAQSFSDLRFLGAASFLKIGDLYAHGDLSMAKASYLKVAEDTSSDMAKYRVLAEERLRALKASPAQAESPFRFQALPLAVASINYVNWYGNTEFAYQSRFTQDCLKNNVCIYGALQGLHSGIDFIAPYGTPIKSVCNRSGVVVSIDNEPHRYKTGPGNVLIDYGEFLVLYGHTQKSHLPEKVQLGAKIDPDDTIAYVGSDTGGLIHLHLEVIRKNPPGSGRPGDIRTNPVPFFSSAALAQLRDKANGIGAEFHLIPGETKWQTPEVQPDIIPGNYFLVP